MLTTIREKTQGIIASFILILIVIPFAMWGINSYFEGGTKVDVAVVNGEKISEQTYRNTLEGFRRQLDPRMADSPEIKRIVVDGLVDKTLLVRDAEQQGYRLDDQRLGQMIRELPYFQRAGQFDPNLYQNLLRREGLSVREFEDQRRLEAMTAQIQTGFSESGIVTESEIASLVRLMKQERQASYALIGVDKYLKSASVKPEAIQEYYKAHPELFSTVEQVRIEYVRLSASELIKGYQPTDAELRSAYSEEAAKAARPESRRVAHILVPLASGAPDDEAKKALAKAQDIEKQIRSGADFAKLAKAHSGDTDSAAKGGDLGDVRPGVLPKALEDAVAAMTKPGQISAPVRTEFGYHIAKLVSYKTGTQKSFEQMKPDLVKQLRQRKSEERFYEASEKFRNTIYEQPESLAPTAEALGLKVESTDWFGRSGGTGVAGHPRIVEAAFSAETLTQGRNSDAIEMSGDTLVAVRVAGHRPVTQKPLADVQPQIERTLKQQAAEQAAKEAGEAALKELNAGQSLEAVARKYGLSIQPPKTFSRDQMQGVDRRIVTAVFKAARPAAGKQVYGGVELSGNGYAVYALSRVVDGDPAKADAATKEKARRTLVARRGQDYYANYRSGLKQKADIDVFLEKL